MKTQSYKNYIRFYTPHHFIFYPVSLVLLCICAYFSITKPEKMQWIFMAMLFALLIWLSYMMRQHYALTLQNRIVRLEVQMRYFTLTGKRLDDFEAALTDAQVFALRFASDEEFVILVERAQTENLTGENIKKSIKNWNADHHRV